MNVSTNINLVEVTRVSPEKPFSLVRANENFIRNEEFYSLATDLTHKISVPERRERLWPYLTFPTYYI